MPHQTTGAMPVLTPNSLMMPHHTTGAMPVLTSISFIYGYGEFET
jgi:hypothetical protein